MDLSGEEGEEIKAPSGNSWTCSLCALGFGQMRYYIRHLFTHLGDKHKWKCDTCGCEKQATRRKELFARKSHACSNNEDEPDAPFKVYLYQFNWERLEIKLGAEGIPTGQVRQQFNTWKRSKINKGYRVPDDYGTGATEAADHTVTPASTIERLKTPDKTASTTRARHENRQEMRASTPSKKKSNQEKHSKRLNINTESLTHKKWTAIKGKSYQIPKIKSVVFKPGETHKSRVSETVSSAVDVEDQKQSLSDLSLSDDSQEENPCFKRVKYTTKPSTPVRQDEYDPANPGMESEQAKVPARRNISPIIFETFKDDRIVVASPSQADEAEKEQDTDKPSSNSQDVVEYPELSCYTELSPIKEVSALSKNPHVLLSPLNEDRLVGDSHDKKVSSDKTAETSKKASKRPKKSKTRQEESVEESADLHQSTGVTDDRIQSAEQRLNAIRQKIRDEETRLDEKLKEKRGELRTLHQQCNQIKNENVSTAAKLALANRQLRSIEEKTKTKEIELWEMETRLTAGYKEVQAMEKDIERTTKRQALVKDKANEADNALAARTKSLATLLTAGSPSSMEDDGTGTHTAATIVAGAMREEDKYQRSMTKWASTHPNCKSQSHTELSSEVGVYYPVSSEWRRDNFVYMPATIRKTGSFVLLETPVDGGGLSSDYFRACPEYAPCITPVAMDGPGRPRRLQTVPVQCTYMGPERHYCCSNQTTSPCMGPDRHFHRPSRPTSPRYGSE